MSTEVQGKAPLDMMQYKRILATNREPHMPLDRLLFAKDSRHVVVAHQGNFYKVKRFLWINKRAKPQKGIECGLASSQDRLTRS